MRRNAKVATLLFQSLLVSIASCATVTESPPGRASAVAAIREFASSVEDAPHDYDTLLDLVGDRRFVLLGDATHGTHEFYVERARVTRRLIEDKGFSIIVIEADWPDAYDVNEFVHGRGAASADAGLETFSRFPRWMWGNEELRDLMVWLRQHNAGAGQDRRAGVYGMDLYSPVESMDDVVGFLRETDSEAAGRAEARYRCFDRYRKSRMEEYGADVALRGRPSCAQAGAAQLDELAQRVLRTPRRQKPGDDRLLSAWQNARVVANAEAYYRTVFRGTVDSWNVRDRHMADTIDALSTHLRQGADPAKVIVWAHNSHLGDARLTARAAAGELNVGQLMRQRHGDDAVLIGFTTFEGMVYAASAWGEEGREQRLRPALRDSFSALFHEAGVPAFVLPLRGNSRLQQALAGTRLQRFVGVIYAPGSERQSHYFETDLARQYDAVVHVDRTSAVRPLRPGGD